MRLGAPQDTEQGEDTEPDPVAHSAPAPECFHDSLHSPEAGAVALVYAGLAGVEDSAAGIRSSEPVLLDLLYSADPVTHADDVVDSLDPAEGEASACWVACPVAELDVAASDSSGRHEEHQTEVASVVAEHSCYKDVEDDEPDDDDSEEVEGVRRYSFDKSVAADSYEGSEVH